MSVGCLRREHVSSPLSVEDRVGRGGGGKKINEKEKKIKKSLIQSVARTVELGTQN